MSLPVRLFPTYPARSAFGVNNAVQNAGDYILQKKLKRLNLVGFATANFRIQHHHDDH